MFITPYFGGCKYTNNFLFINKNIEFQHFDLLITPSAYTPKSLPQVLLWHFLPRFRHSHPQNRCKTTFSDTPVTLKTDFPSQVTKQNDFKFYFLTFA